MKKILRNRKGNSCFNTAVTVLAIAMIFSVVLEFASVMTVVSTVENNTQRTLNSFIMKNAKEIFTSIKDGHDFIARLNNDDFVGSFDEELNLEKYGNFLYSRDEESNTVFVMDCPSTTYMTDRTLKLVTSFQLKVPVHFAGRKLFDIEIPMKVKSNYILKY